MLRVHTGVAAREATVFLAGVLACGILASVIGCQRSERPADAGTTVPKADQPSEPDSKQPLTAVRKLLALVAPSNKRVTDNGQTATSGGNGTKVIDVLDGYSHWVGIPAQSEVSPAQVRQAIGEPHLVKPAEVSGLGQALPDRWYYRYDDWLLVEVSFRKEKVGSLKIQWTSKGAPFQEDLRLFNLVHKESFVN